MPERLPDNTSEKQIDLPISSAIDEEVNDELRLLAGHDLLERIIAYEIETEQSLMERKLNAGGDG